MLAALAAVSIAGAATGLASAYLAAPAAAATGSTAVGVPRAAAEPDGPAQAGRPLGGVGAAGPSSTPRTTRRVVGVALLGLILVVALVPLIVIGRGVRPRSRSAGSRRSSRRRQLDPVDPPTPLEGTAGSAVTPVVAPQEHSAPPTTPPGLVPAPVEPPAPLPQVAPAGSSSGAPAGRVPVAPASPESGGGESGGGEESLEDWIQSLAAPRSKALRRKASQPEAGQDRAGQDRAGGKDLPPLAHSPRVARVRW